MKTKKTRNLIFIAAFWAAAFLSPASAFASKNMSPVAVNIMREVKFLYKTEKADAFISHHLRERHLNEEQISDIRRRLDFFFDSQTFIETGALYLSAMFSENELREIDDSARFGNLLQNHRLQRLLAKLDPYLYMYLVQNIMR